ncbi:MAG TPA: hypothetical protein VIC05_02760 [Solirubrobacteraceae bacterium]|jgi:hypothetical protein
MTLALAQLALAAGAVQARRISHYNPGAHRAARAKPATPAGHPAPKPPPEPPRTTETSSKASSEEASGSSPYSTGSWSEGDGGGSPLCRSRGVLSLTQLRNCETADFVAAPDPTGNYAFDVNINTGVSNWGNDIAATIQNFLQFAWISLVALVHGLLLMLEWCYSLDILRSRAMTEIAHGLHETQLTFTKPWMVVVLAVGSVLALYHGLIRRRVAATLGQVLMMLAMMVGGLVVIANPQGTVGELSGWADRASLGTLSAVTTGSPNNGKRTLAGALQSVFGTVVTAPWCYLEFGSERWCFTERDKELRSAALKIAATEEEESKCGKSCSAHVSSKARALSMSARLLREANSNGELFLALPANEKQRNSVKTSGTLLNVLCKKSESADDCADPTGAQAEFRTEKGTEQRVIGLVLIWIGALGMLLLLGYLAFRLLEAAIAAIFYLLLAPAAVLAPALGDGGRAAFRGWSMRLLSAVTAKLIYSLLLGVVLLMAKVLLRATALGWWAQWLLVSTLWWVVLHHRHKVLSFAGASGVDHGTRSMRWYYKLRMAQDAVHLAGWARHKLVPPGAESNRTRRVPRPQAERQGPSRGPGAGGGRESGGGGGGGGRGPVPPNEGGGPSLGAPAARGYDWKDEQATGPEREPGHAERPPPREEPAPQAPGDETPRPTPAQEPAVARFDSGLGVAAPVTNTAAKGRPEEQEADAPAAEPESRPARGERHRTPASAEPPPAAGDSQVAGGSPRRAAATPTAPGSRQHQSDRPEAPASKAPATAAQPPTPSPPLEPKRTAASASAAVSAHGSSSDTNDKQRAPATSEGKRAPFSAFARGHVERTNTRPLRKAGTSRGTQLKKDDPDDHDGPRPVPRPPATRGH